MSVKIRASVLLLFLALLPAHFLLQGCSFMPGNSSTSSAECAASATAAATATLPPPPANFTPMPADAPGKEPLADYARKRMEKFAAQDLASLQNATVFLGDSLTERFAVEQYFPNERVVNRGIGGDSMGGVRHTGVLNRLESTVYNLSPRRIILMIGFNDVAYSAGTPFDVKLLQYDYLVWKLRHDLPNTELWCVSVLPAREQFAEKNPAIRDFDANAAKAAKLYGAHWLDIYNEFLDENGVLKKEYAADSVHLSKAGCELLARLYNEHIFQAK